MAKFNLEVANSIYTRFKSGRARGAKYYLPLGAGYLKGVLNLNFRLLSFKLKKIRFLKINFGLGFRVL